MGSDITSILQNLKREYPKRIHGIIAYIDSPALDKPLQIGTGVADPATKAPMHGYDQFRCASICKMFVAATLLRLREKGLIALDDHVAKFLPAELMNGLDTYRGVDYSGEITLYQCLSHTSGLWDYYLAGKPDSAGSLPIDIELSKHPNQYWTMEDTLTWGKNQGFEATSKPGSEWHYSDSNYQLVGLVIEKVSKKSLAVAVRELVLNPAGMKDTYAEFREPPHRSAGVQLAHWFDGEEDLTDRISESSDYAGGGWLTSAPDLAAFIRGLCNGKLLADPYSWKLMQQWTDASNHNYCLGLAKCGRYSGFGDMVGHSGYYASRVEYSPDTDTVIVFSVNQHSPMEGSQHRDWFQKLDDQICLAVGRSMPKANGVKH